MKWVFLVPRMTSLCSLYIYFLRGQQYNLNSLFCRLLSSRQEEVLSAQQWRRVNPWFQFSALVRYFFLVLISCIHVETMHLFLDSSCQLHKTITIKSTCVTPYPLMSFSLLSFCCDVFFAHTIRVEDSYPFRCYFATVKYL